MTLATGLHPVPNGHLAAVVTYLEMTAPAITTPVPFPDGISAARERLSIAEYKALFRAIGTPWLWQSRLVMAPDVLAAILDDDLVETWVIREADKAIGLVELNFRTPCDCDLAFFGLIEGATGKGLGRPMMAHAQTQAFAHPITRLHLHTCTLDAPQALGFYQKSGFTAVKRCIDVFPDPRLSGTLPKNSGTHIPCVT